MSSRQRVQLLWMSFPWLERLFSARDWNLHRSAPDPWKASAEVAKPAYGCQVTIQSELEKQMMKLHRREEKKERKKGKGADEGDASDAVLNFDPREMRALR